MSTPTKINKPSCEHQWIASAFEVKEHFPNGQIKMVKATQVMCVRCGEWRDL